MDKILGDDIKYMKQLMKKKIEIKTTDGKCFSGIVYVIDPITKSIILYDDNNKNTAIIFQSGIKSLEVLDNVEDSSEVLLECTSEKHLTEEEHRRRKKLKDWLNNHCIEMDDDGRTLKLGNDLLIEAPYDKNSCYSGNIIILERIRSIIDKMPDYE